MNENNIQIAIISAGLAALINCIFQFGDKIFSYIKERHENKDKKREDFNDIYWSNQKASANTAWL